MIAYEKSIKKSEIFQVHQLNKLDVQDCLVALFTYNNGPDLEATLHKFGTNFPYSVVVHVDGSTDGSDECLQNFPFTVLRTQENCGIGRSVKNVIEYAITHNFKVLALIAGNNKNDVQELSRLIEPILNDQADYVQGSRYLPGSKHDHTPLFRLIMVKVHALLFSLVTGHKCTDALEGVRAYKLSIFDDLCINIWQDWLDTYEYETYVHYKVLTLGYRVIEVPVSKVYPSDRKRTFSNRAGKKYSHIRPFIDWWKITKPLFFLMFGLKK